MKLSNKIKIHPLTILFIMVGCITGYFRYIVYIMSILLVHETGHIIASKLLKRKITEITVMPFGGLIKMNSIISSDIFEDILIASAGVGLQTILGFILIYLEKNGFIDASTYSFFNNYNILIIIFNLMPICPLDGYKIWKGMLELFIPFKATFIFAIFSSACIFLGVMSIDYSIVFDNPFVFVFLFFAMWEEAKNIKYIMMRFYVERMNRHFFYPTKNIKKTESMYKNKVHYIENVPESVYLKRQFTQREK